MWGYSTHGRTINIVFNHKHYTVKSNTICMIATDIQ